MLPSSQRLRQYTKSAFAIAALGLLVTSCSETKLSQCKKLIDVANQVVMDVQTVAQNASTTGSNAAANAANAADGADSIAVINKVAEAADKARINMESLTLTDERLQDFQDRYASMYTEIGQTTREMLAAAEAKDREAGREAYDAFKAATSQEEVLVDEINEYCAQ